MHRDRMRFGRRGRVMAMAVSLTLGAAPAWSVTSTVPSSPGSLDGSPGLNGSTNLPGGGNASAGVAAVATASSADASNTATASGGAGGVGGYAEYTGYSAGAGGTGAKGTAGASGTAGTNYSDSATATGGAGGAGGKGGAGLNSFESGGMGGLGGAGGAAQSSSNTTSTGSTPVVLTALSTGGAGGAGGAGGDKGGSHSSTGKAGIGGNGGEADLGYFTVSSNSNVTMNATLIGGSGGAGSTGGNGGSTNTVSQNSVYMNGGTTASDNLIGVGGNGGSGSNGNGGSGGLVYLEGAPILNSVNGTTMSCTQTGYGGNGGSSVNGVAGAGGYANMIAEITPNNAAGSTNCTSIAFGGSGGAGQNTNGANAGSTSAESDFNQNNVASSEYDIGVAYANYNGSNASVVPSGGNVTSGTGNGGAGNGAYAEVSTASNETPSGFAAAPFFDANSSAVAYGSNGGSVLTGAVGNGGAGGGADADAYAIGIQAVAAATAIGGNGGQGQGAGNAGGNGGVATSDGINVESDGGVYAIGQMTVVGGNGGAGVNGAAGGNGAAENISNDLLADLTSFQANTVTMQQMVTGGTAGSIDGGPAGIAGDATSSVPVDADYTYQVVSLISAATAGGGSNAQNTNGGNGGNSNASINGPVKGGVSATSTATGLQGGSVTAGTGIYTGGAGGTSTAVSALAELGGDTSQTISCTAQATGAKGGDITSGLTGTGGAGGQATSNASASGISLYNTVATSTAIGGAGGQGSSNGFYSGAGGTALAIATATNTVGPANASAAATGGSAGVVTGSASSGATGAATATALASGTTNVNGSTSASAVASGLASVGNAIATGFGSYNLTSGVLTNASGNASSGSAISAVQFNISSSSFIATQATAAVDNTAKSFATCNTGSGATSFSLLGTQQAIASLTNSVSSTDAGNAWNTSSFVSHAFGSTANATAIGVSVEQVQSASSGTSHTYSTVSEMNLSSGSLSAGQLLLGGTKIEELSNGLNAGGSLRFRIERQGVAVIDQTFITNAAFVSYLQNTVFDLGTENANVGTGNLDVQVLFDFSAGAHGQGLGSQFVMGVNPSLFQVTWNGSTGQSWTQPINWQYSTLPNGPGASALFSLIGSTAQTVNLDTPTTLGNLQFNSSNGYTLAPGANGLLTLDNGGTAAALTVTTGNPTITAPVYIAASGVSVDVSGGNTLTIGGSVNGSGNGSGGVTKVNSGTLNLDGATTLGGLTINAGKVTFGPLVQSALATSSLSFAGSTGHWQGILDLSGNDLIVHNGTLSTLTDQIREGYGNGSWNGAGGVLSSAAAANSTHLTALGVISNNSGTGTYYTSFDKQNVFATDLLVKYTYYGDTDLSGLIDGTDYSRIDSSFLANGMHPNSMTGWFNGDFNYDGSIDGSDYTLMDNAFNNQGGTPLAELAAGPTVAIAAEIASSPLSATAVPEPASITLLGIGCLAMLGRRRPWAKK